MLKRILAVLIGLWLGAQWLGGYVVAPLLFMNLPKTEAGTIAGHLFAYVGYFGLLLWALVAYVGRLKQERSFLKSSTLGWIGVLWGLTAANQWLVSPVIQALKTGSSQWLFALTGGSFGIWHGISSTLYLLCSLIGLYLAAKLLRFEWH